MVGRTNAGGKTVRVIGVSITSPPDQVEYSVDDTLDLTGLVVTAAYSDGTTQDVTSQCAFSPAEGTVLNTGHTRVTITWKGNTLYQAISVVDVHIYGVYWGGTGEPGMTRTDDASEFVDPVPYVSGASAYESPFDDLMPWKGMVRVSDSEAGELVAIPKFWYKWTRSGDSMKLQIADKATEGFLVSPAHADRGDGKGERDVVYVGRYHCASDYKSKTGNLPKANITRSAARSGIHNLGSTIWQWDYAMLWTIRMLYLVEFAHWNSQAKIGYGCGNNSGTQNMGASDNMPYHTGTMQSSRTTYGVGCQYRYIEGFWDNVLDWCDGIYFNSADIYCIKNPASFSDSSGGTKVGSRATSSNCIKKWNAPTADGFEYALYPSEVVSDSNYATYVCDRCDYDGSPVLYVGGYCNQRQYRGLFYMSDNDASYSYGSIGSRLQKLP